MRRRIKKVFIMAAMLCMTIGTVHVPVGATGAESSAEASNENEPSGENKPDGETEQGDENKPDGETEQGDENKPDGETEQGDENKPDGETEQGDENKPGNETKPGDENKPDGETEPSDGNQQNDGNNQNAGSPTPVIVPADIQTQPEETTSASAYTTQATTEETDPRESYTIRKFSVADINHVEQVISVAPKAWAFIYIEGNSSKTDTDSICAYIDDRELETVSIRSWKQSGMGINYYVLLDTSENVSKANFDAFKEEIEAIAEKHMRGGADTLTVYAVCGDTASKKPLIDHMTGADTEEIYKILDDVKQDGAEAYLDKAVDQAVSDIGRKREAAGAVVTGRDILLAFSGGFSTSAKGSEDGIKETLTKECVPLYVFMQSTKDAKEKEAFENIATESGGDICVLDDQEQDMLADNVSDLVAKLEQVYVAEFDIGSNMTDEDVHSFSVDIFLDDIETRWQYAERNIMLTRNLPDNIPPEVVEVSLTGDSQLTVVFSESVVRADVCSAYRFCDEAGNEIKVTDVVRGSSGKVYYLTLEDTVYQGNYTLSFYGIADDSVEQNVLATPEWTCNFEDAPVYEEEKEKKSSNLRLIVLIIVFAVTAALAVALIILRKRRIELLEKKRAEEKKAEEEKKKRQAAERMPKEGDPITLFVNSGGKLVEKIETRIKGSIIIGRSDLCDVFVDDVAMSRQHFAIEKDGDSFYVQDLDTTNGTLLNGAKLTHKRRLEKNDRITAGSMDIVVRW